MTLLPDPGVVSFARGIPPPEALPSDLLAECAARVIRREGRTVLNYGPPAGYEPLRAWLAERHGVAAERVLVTPGSLLGLNLVVRALGGPLAVEHPTYDRMLHLARGHGATVEGVELERLPQGARLLYVMPTFHNPTGRTLDLDARVALVEQAIERELLVFEDDPYGELRFEGEPLPTLHALLHERGAGELALYASSFSKIVAPGLRVGYVLLPERLVAPLRELALGTYVSPPTLAQAELLEFLRAGLLEPHLERLRRLLRARRDALLSALEAELGEAARWTVPAGGYFVWIDLPGDARALLARADGVAFVPGAEFFADGGGERSARLSFSFPPPGQIQEGIRRLAAAVLA